jgi:hypothetical protein
MVETALVTPTAAVDFTKSLLESSAILHPPLRLGALAVAFKKATANTPRL